MSSKEMREKRAKIVEDARALIDSVDDDIADGELKEIDAKFDRMMDEADKLEAKFLRSERLEDKESQLAERLEIKSELTGQPVAQLADADERYSAVFKKFMMLGVMELEPEERSLMRNNFQEIRGQQATAPGTAGGYTIPEGFRTDIDVALLAFGGMRAASRIIVTDSGNNLPWPTVNDTGNKAVIVGENTLIGDQDLTFGQVVFVAYKYSSKFVKVSLELLQDERVGMQSLIAGLLATRIFRGTNEHFTTGTGTDEPEGVITGSTEGHVGTTGQTTTVIYEDLVDLEHSVDPAYRAMGAQFMFHDQTLRALKKLKDQDGRPLWLPGIAVREPDTILSYPYTINQDVPVMAADAKSILFGDFSKYVIRDVFDITLIRLEERFAELGQVAFVTLSRHDGRMIDAGTNPIKHYANSST